jgi:hypothetical protein
LQTLNANLKRNIKLASAIALKFVHPITIMSKDILYPVNNKAQPHHILLYKLALELSEIVRDQIPSREWLALNYSPPAKYIV